MNLCQRSAVSPMQNHQELSEPLTQSQRNKPDWSLSSPFLCNFLQSTASPSQCCDSLYTQWAHDPTAVSSLDGAGPPSKLPQFLASPKLASLGMARVSPPEALSSLDTYCHLAANHRGRQLSVSVCFPGRPLYLYHS